MFRTALAAATVLATVAAQQTYVVDASGGGDFIDLPAAFAAVAHGDRVEVRSGRYQAATLRHGIQVFADPGARLNPGSVLVVRDVPAGESATLSGFINPIQGVLGDGYGIVLINNDGRVHLENMRSAFSRLSGALLLAVERCAAVTVTRCEFTGSPALALNGGRMVCSASRITGVGIHAGCHVDGDLELVNCTAIGGSSGLSPAPAIKMWTGSTRLTAGTKLFSGLSHLISVDLPDVDVAGGTLEIDPSVVFDSIRGLYTLRELPALTLLSAAPGSVAFGVHASQPTFAAVVVDLPALPVPTPYGELWVDPARAASVHFGLVHQNRIQRTIPPWASGTTLTFQALLLAPSGGRLSPPVSIAVR